MTYDRDFELDFFDDADKAADYYQREAGMGSRFMDCLRTVLDAVVAAPDAFHSRGPQNASGGRPPIFLRRLLPH